MHRSYVLCIFPASIDLVVSVYVPRWALLEPKRALSQNHPDTSCRAFPLGQPPNSALHYFLLSLSSLRWSSWPSFWRALKSSRSSHFSRKLLKNCWFRTFPKDRTQTHTHTSCRAIPLGQPTHSALHYFLLSLPSLPWSSWPSFWKALKRLLVLHFSGQLFQNHWFRTFGRDCTHTFCKAFPLRQPPNSALHCFLLSLPSLPRSSCPSFWETLKKNDWHFSGEFFKFIGFTFFEESHKHTILQSISTGAAPKPFLPALPSLPWSSWPSFRKTQKISSFSHFFQKTVLVPHFSRK